MPDPLFTPNAAATLSPSLNLDESKEINPQARELLTAQQTAADPLSQFTKAEPAFQDAGGAKPINLNARAELGGYVDPLAQFTKAAPASPIPGFEKADDLDSRSTDELNADRPNFNPVTYLQMHPEVANSPARLSKLLDVYRKRREEGLDAKEVVKNIFSKETGGAISNIPAGVKRLGERAIDVTIQPISNIILGTLTGDLFDEQKRNALFNETRKIIKKGTAEVSAGSESASVGLVDLSRQGLRKLDTAYTPTPLSAMGDFSPQESIPLKKPLTDQELLRDISDDVAFRQNAAEILTGQGEAAKKLGLDKETLAKQGIELDEKAIEQLSLVDPITMVATGGAFKLVGLGGKILGTARTIEGAKLIAEKLADLAKYSAGKTIQGTGKLISGTGELLKGSGTGLSTVSAAITGATGGGVTPALITGVAVKSAGPLMRKFGPVIEHAGKAIAGEVPVSAALQKVVDYAKIPGRAISEVGGGVFTGFAAAAPFAVMADEDTTAGTLFGVGGGLGGAHAGVALPFRVVTRAASRRYFGENRPLMPDVASPGYGEATSDALHDTQMQKLSAQDASEVNNFREILRPLGKKILAVDAPTFRTRIKELMPNVTPEQLDIFENHSALFDSKDTVYLNSDATNLRHDAGHLFDALLSPEKRTELRTAIKEAFGQKSLDDFKAEYERRVGSKISDAAGLDEYVAEQFNALFYNVPVTELNAPKGLLSKFIDTAAEGAEALGIDLTEGAKTPLIGAPVSVGLRKIFQNAAGEVTRRSAEAKAAPAAPAAPVTPPRAAPDLNLPPDFFQTFPGGPATPAAPAAPVPPVAPVAPAPVPPAPAAPNIRVTPEQVGAFTRPPEAPATPAARAAAAERAAETGVDYARAEAKKDDGSTTSKIIEQISDAMESGRPVVGIEHLGITSAGTPEGPIGATLRKAEQAGGYAALNAAQLDVRQNAPPEIVALHSKNFVPVRWTNQGGTPTLTAMSLDKVISNILRIASDKTVQDLIPYAVENGKLTPEGWREVVADAQAYSENQANGRKGDGGRLEVPEAGLSIPAENPTYTPQPLSPERANFQNLVQGLAPPQTNRAPKGEVPGNVKGQLLAEANRRAVELPAVIPTKQAGKQAFVEFPPRVIQEVNPLRNEMARRGVRVRDLLEVTERIRAKDIVSATARPEVNYKAPVTDIIRGGFAPGPEDFRSKNLGAQSVEEFGKKILTASPEQWKAATDNMTGGLTGGAWNLGLGLKDAADVGTLKSFADQLTAAGKTAMAGGDLDAAGSLFTRSQFFREAYEAATGTGSAGAAFKRGAAGEFKPPFPSEIQGASFAPGDEGSPARTGLEFKKFFSDVASGKFGKSEVPFTPLQDLRDVANVETERLKHWGNFENHIQRSIPMLHEEKTRLADGVIKTFGDTGARLLDIGSSEGDFGKAISALTDGKVETVSLDPNPQMAADFKNISTVKGATHTEDAFLAGFEDNGKVYSAHNPEKPYDLINEAVTFQFIDPNRDAQVAEVKRMLTPDGIFTTAEKFKTSEWAKNEAKKDTDYKDKYFTKAELSDKEKRVGFQQSKEEEKAVGMVDNMVSDTQFEDTLKKHFKHVVQYWDSGNFKGYAASDNPTILARFVKNIGDLNSEFSTVETPRVLEGGTFAPKTEAGRRLEEKGYEIIPSGEKGIRRVAIHSLDGDEIASIQSVQRSPKTAEIAMVVKAKGAPKGLGEVLYREIGAQLKTDGVTSLGGQVIAPEPLAIRKKIFRKFASLEINGEPATYEQAIASAERLRGSKPSKEGYISPGELEAAKGDVEVAAIEPVNSINAFTRFAPGKRDAQGRPLDKAGNIDYAKWQKEGIAARRKQRAESDATPSIKEVGPKVEETEPTKSTGWILPSREFVPLDTNFHEQYLAENADTLNEKFGTSFNPEESSIDDRLAALNAGFVRLRNYNGRLSVEANAAKWPSLKRKVLETLQDREGQIDSLTVSLLDNEGQQVDSTSANRLHEMSGPEKLNALEEAVSTVRPSGPRFAPGPGLPGFEDVSAEQAGRLKAKRRISAVKKNNPEAISPKYARDESGDIIVSADGTPKPLTLDYDFINSPVAKEAAKGLKGAAREAAAADALGDALTALHRSVEDRPDIKAGAKWYSTARTRLKKIFGNDSKLFAELLGATSARTPVETNYRFALDAYNQFKAGAFDETLAKYREGKNAWEAGDIADFLKDTKAEEPTRGQFIDWWVKKHDLGVTQASGKKYGMNSRSVLRVLDGSWAAEVQGPKTPNFAGNLTGATFEATIDVWAARLLHRLANEGKKDRWRILPENETGVTDADFYLGQAAYRNAAKQLGIKPDALQAILWFAEKDHYEKKGWTRGAGAAKSDFNVLLAETERTPEGTLQMRTPQIGLDFGAKIGDIVKKKK